MCLCLTASHNLSPLLASISQEPLINSYTKKLHVISDVQLILKQTHTLSQVNKGWSPSTPTHPSFLCSIRIESSSSLQQTHIAVKPYFIQIAMGCERYYSETVLERLDSECDKGPSKGSICCRWCLPHHRLKPLVPWHVKSPFTIGNKPCSGWRWVCVQLSGTENFPVTILWTEEDRPFWQQHGFRSERGAFPISHIQSMYSYPVLQNCLTEFLILLGFLFLCQTPGNHFGDGRDMWSKGCDGLTAWIVSMMHRRVWPSVWCGQPDSVIRLIWTFFSKFQNIS